MSERADLPIRLGVSSCLLGEAVRYDGGHKRDRFLTDLLGRHVEWVPVCPELEAGLGVPRPAMRLEREGGRIHLREIASGRDHTVRMQRFAARRLRALRALELCGYVLKKDSPSCGMARVKLYGEKGVARREASGIFAAALRATWPSLPIEDEGRLHDPALRENFIERVFAYRRVRELFRGRWTAARVVAFHTAHKLQLMAHSQEANAELGRRVAAQTRIPRAEMRRSYSERFMDALAHGATRGRNANVLQHAAGHLKKHLDAPARAELSSLIHDYRRGLVPLVVPITLLHHHARAHAVAYLQGQTFLEPHPRELMLRNEI
ncbi:MAG TPA: DUF523 and DUF1722 domain-containing protein [Myxococcota bacterium]|nr:DUF523 and DUF1722 domain-containing protein [Myxococcota bacterium]